MYFLGDVVAPQVECQTSDREIAGYRWFDSRLGTARGTILGMLFTPLYLCHQAV